MTNDTLRDGTWIVCHDTVPPYPHDVASAAMCRGFPDLFGERSEGVRFLREAFGFDEVARPEDRSSTSGQRLHRDRPPR
ncbi:hypothetical protein [Nonomuraea sp. NPDC050786]|uniref:hypothetical protein n=1 Tax=Nonomuraea sp. NPDC050786 TaxID=3154840 RepID=UPI0033FE1AB7